MPEGKLHAGPSWLAAAALASTGAARAVVNPKTRLVVADQSELLRHLLDASGERKRLDFPLELPHFAGGPAIFEAHGSRESAQAFYADIKGQAQQLGRRPQDIVILPGISAAIGSAEYEARQVWEELDSLTGIEVGLNRLSARFGGHDFPAVPLDRPLTRGDFPDPEQVQASKSRAVGYVETSLRDGLTLRGHFGLGELAQRPLWQAAVGAAPQVEAVAA